MTLIRMGAVRDSSPTKWVPCDPPHGKTRFTCGHSVHIWREDK